MVFGTSKCGALFALENCGLYRMFSILLLILDLFTSPWAASEANSIFEWGDVEQQKSAARYPPGTCVPGTIESDYNLTHFPFKHHNIVSSESKKSLASTTPYGIIVN